jgi:GDP-L-fucose synthase
MKIMVTGATGFLGKFLCHRLEQRGDEVIKVSSKNCDLEKASSLQQFEGYKFDVIFHLAAWTQAGDFCLYHSGDQWIKNQRINTNILAFWQSHQKHAKMIGVGTSCSYDADILHEEENYLKGKPIDSLLSYAMTKRMLLYGLMALHKQYGLNYLYVIPSTLYGANYHTDGRQMHFIFDLIRKIILGKYYDIPVVLWGDGYQQREVILVEDFVNTMLLLLPNHSNEIINIGAGKEHTIREFAKKIADRVGYDFDKIQFDTTKHVGARSKVLKIDKLKRVLPNFSPQPLDDGLDVVIDWFLQNKKKLLDMEKVNI